jgi:hypothetical protein
VLISSYGDVEWLDTGSCICLWFIVVSLSFYQTVDLQHRIKKTFVECRSGNDFGEGIGVVFKVISCNLYEEIGVKPLKTKARRSVSRHRIELEISVFVIKSAP